MILLVLAVAGACGAITRYAVDHLVTSMADTVLPWGTFAVNVSASFLAGLVVGLAAGGGVSDGLASVATIGFLGGYSTFSTFVYETVRLLEERARVMALAKAVGALVAGIVAVAGGVAVGSLV